MSNIDTRIHTMEISGWDQLTLVWVNLDFVRKDIWLIFETKIKCLNI